MPAQEQEAEHRLVDTLLRLHGFGRQAHLPAGLLLTGALVAGQQPELDTIGLVEGEFPVELRGMVHASLDAPPHRVDHAIDRHCRRLLS